MGHQREESLPLILIEILSKNTNVNVFKLGNEQSWKALIYKERIDPIQYLQDQGRFMGFQQFT